MTCPYASSGCNGPVEGQCMNLCLPRLIRPVERRMPIEFSGPEPEDKPESLWSRVWSAYKAHRPHGRMNGIRHAFAAWRN